MRLSGDLLFQKNFFNYFLNKISFVILLISLFFLINCGHDPSEDGYLVPKTVVDDPNLPSANINGAKLHLKVSGSAAASGNNIIFLHGGPGFDFRALEPLKDKVQASITNHKIVMYDQRGGGLSQRFDADNESLSVAGHVADLEAIRQTFFSGQTMKVVAHSWGGALLQAYLASYPNAVTHAVFIASMPAKNDAADDLLTSIFDAAAGDYTWQRNLLGESHAELDFRFINFIPAQTYYYCSASDYKRVRYWRYGYVAAIKSMERGLLDGPPAGPSVTYKFDFTASNALVNSAVLVQSAFIIGACDTKLGAKAAGSIRNTLNAANKRDILTISGAGHYVFVDQLDLTAAEVILGLQ